MHPSPGEEAAIRAEFDRLANLTQAEMRAWLEAHESRRVGMVREGRGRIGARANGAALDPSVDSLANLLKRQVACAARRH